MNNDKSTFIKYVYLLNRLEDEYNTLEKLTINEEDQKLMDEVKKLTANNPELHEFLKQLHALDSFERLKAVEEKFNEKDNIEKSEEKEISKVFGVNVEDIKHHLLENGNELFYFYDINLGRNVVLENQKRGESLVEQLKKVQEENEKYQFEGDSKETREMLMTEGQIHNMELDMQSKEEILSQNVLDRVDEDDERLLKYLLKNYEELQIDSINVENMIFMDKSGNIKEASFDKDKNITVGTPSSANYGDGNKESISEGTGTVDASLEEESEEEKEDKNDFQFIEGKIEEKEKQKVLVKKLDNYPNSQGYVNNYLIFSLIFAVFLYLLLGVILFGKV